MAQTVKSLNALAVVLERPGELTLRSLPLPDPGAEDAVVDMLWSGISTGTERLLWSGAMPPFPGMGYPLVPGYESVGRVVLAGERSQRRAGEHVFVPGARCYGAVRGLFGGAASRVVVPGARLLPVDERLGERAVLMALAATAYHAVHAGELPQLIVGHGVLGRLVARLCVLAGVRPVVWESDPARREASTEYAVMDPGQDDRHDYASVCDVSGDASLLDTLVQRLAPGGEIVLAGFYSERLSFAFPPAFMREARLRVAAEWKPADLAAVTALAASGALCLDGLITHRRDASQAHEAYRTAFEDSRCLKMILDWRTCG